MEEKTNVYANILALILDIGEALVYAGAEIGRVEDTITRMAKTYGAHKVDAFALTSVIFVTVSFPGDIVLTQERRVAAVGQTNFVKIEKLNSLSRKCCKQALTREELKQEIDAINSDSIHGLYIYLGSILAAAGFVVFFGGHLLDAFVSGLFAIAICFLSDILSPKIPNKVFYYFITSLIIGFGICLTSKFIPLLNADKIIIGDIMVLVPGIALTNAVKNVLIGDTLSAVVKLAECLVWTCALAGGFMIPIALLLGG